ncbi:hypothetical protein [Citrobacter murliniae]
MTRYLPYPALLLPFSTFSSWTAILLTFGFNLSENAAPAGAVSA